MSNIELIAKNIKGNVLKMIEEDSVEDSPFTRVIYLIKLKKIAEENSDMFPGYFLKTYFDVLEIMTEEQKRLTQSW